MKTSLFYVPFAAALLAGTAATAGGYISPVVEQEITVVEPTEPLTWKGGYVGATLGYGFNGDDRVGYSRNDHIFATPGTLEIAGVNGGIRAGYRTQFTGHSRDWVVGAELAFEAGSIDDSFTKGDFTAENSINSVLGLRVKTGVLNEAKNTLFYGIIGVVQADVDYSISGVDGPTAFDIAVEGESMSGYVVGLGVERKMNERLSLTGEWEYANFGKEKLGDSGFPYSTEMTPKYHNLKVGLNYQF